MSIFEAVKQSVTTRQAAERYGIRVERNGMCRCPFHDDSTPSMKLDRRYYCFGCGAGGNVFTFIMNYENYTFAEAIKLLADRAGIALPEIEDSKEAREKGNRRKTLLQINKEAATYFYYQLRAPQGRVGLDYLKDRQLSDETMNRFGLGYSNKTSNDLCQYLRHKGYPDELIRESGVAVFNEKYGMSDKFWNRVMFPIQDVNHRVIGFGGRVMGEGEPKYLNSPETPVFDKSRNLYGLNFARTARQDNIILCEGYMDVISMHQMGVENVVSSSGTALTTEQIRMIHRFTENITVLYDGDAAGIKASERGIDMLLAEGMNVKLLLLPDGDDPDSFARKHNATEYQAYLNGHQVDFIKYKTDLLLHEAQGDPIKLSRLISSIVHTISVIPDEITRSVYTRETATMLNME